MMAATGNLHGVMAAMRRANVQSTLPYQHPGLDQMRQAVERKNAQNLAITPEFTPDHQSHIVQ